MGKVERMLIVDEIIERLGKEEDKRAYEKIAEIFSHGEIVEAIEIAERKKETGELRTEPRKYFMGIMKMKAKKKNARLFGRTFEKSEFRPRLRSSRFDDND